MFIQKQSRETTRVFEVGDVILVENDLLLVIGFIDGMFMNYSCLSLWTRRSRSKAGGIMSWHFGPSARKMG
jgi:hypothetical protein